MPYHIDFSPALAAADAAHAARVTAAQLLSTQTIATAALAYDGTWKTYPTWAAAVTQAEATRDATIAASLAQREADYTAIAFARSRIDGYGDYIDVPSAMSAVIAAGINVSWVNIWKAA